jgi:transposase
MALVPREVRTFSTMTADVLLLNDWLETLQVSVVALERTGVFWRPVFNLLEDGRTIVLVNPQHRKRGAWAQDRCQGCRVVGGSLAAWAAHPQFHSAGPYPRIAGVNPLPQEPGRGARPRSEPGARCCWKARTSSWHRWPPMCWARVGGRGLWRSSPESRIQRAFLNWLRGACASFRPELQRALDGRLLGQHRILLQHLLAHIDYLEQSRAELEAEIERCLAPFGQAVALAQSLPGIAETAASAIIAELGTDMTRFASEKHVSSWAGVCPGNKQSGGKRLSGKTTKGNPYLRAVLGEVAWAISHTKDNYLSAQFHRIARRRGKQKAVVAVSHSVLIILYHMLREGKPYSDLGPDYFEKLEATRIERYHVRRLEQLGFTVTLTPVPAA